MALAWEPSEAHTLVAMRAAKLPSGVVSPDAPILPVPHAGQDARRTETPSERHARRLAWGAEWGQISRELAAEQREKRG